MIGLTEFRPGFNFEVDACCYSYINYPRVGDLTKTKADKIWHNSLLNSFRKSIIDGSYKYCKHDTCPDLMNKSDVMKTYDELPEKLKEMVDDGSGKTKYGPLGIDYSFDQECNLACPSCRSGLVKNTESQEKIIKKISNDLENLSEDVEQIYISGSGDPFGSRASREWLLNFDKSKYPNLKRFVFHTNANLLTPRMWEKVYPLIEGLEIIMIISIDASTPETYDVVRKNGNFFRLQDNLENIKDLKEKGLINCLDARFVVQKDNYTEMLDFVDFCRYYKFDKIIFTKLEDWDVSNEDHKSKTIHLPDHPLHNDFLKYANDPKLDADDIMRNF